MTGLPALRKATLSADERYRFLLEREWDARGGHVAFVMLNPSTADATKDDPTIRKCIGFARRWRYGGIRVVNLFAFRATDPRQLYSLREDDATGGTRNDEAIYDACCDADVVLAAWGVHGGLFDRDRTVRDLFRLWNIVPECLGVTKDGLPRHPLMPAYATPLVVLP